MSGDSEMYFLILPALQTSSTTRKVSVSSRHRLQWIVLGYHGQWCSFERGIWRFIMFLSEPHLYGENSMDITWSIHVLMTLCEDVEDSRCMTRSIVFPQLQTPGEDSESLNCMKYSFHRNQEVFHYAQSANLYWRKVLVCSS